MMRCWYCSRVAAILKLITEMQANHQTAHALQHTNRAQNMNKHFISTGNCYLIIHKFLLLSFLCPHLFNKKLWLWSNPYMAEENKFATTVFLLILLLTIDDVISVLVLLVVLCFLKFICFCFQFFKKKS